MADWDSTVVVRYGHQEDATIGYNPQNPGCPSHHPLACVIGGTRLCLHMEWRKGNTVSASGWAWDTWQGRSNEGLVQLAELDLKLSGWSRSRRVVVERTFKPLNASPQGSFWQQCEEEFSAYVTNLTLEEADGFQIVELYRQRGDAENVFDELKNQWGFAGF